MAIRTKVVTRSTGRLQRQLRKGRQARRRGMTGVEIGYYDTARYPDGTPVTNVAAWMEFGTEINGKPHTPPRPSMRQANVAVRSQLLAFLRQAVDPATLVVTLPIAKQVGNILKNALQTSILKLRDPPNAPRTIAAKKSSNPLIDTGKMRTSATYKVRRN